MIVSNSSPLIALGRINRLDIFHELFDEVVIPSAVYRETVVETRLDVQRDAILRAIASRTIRVIEPLQDYAFVRRLDAGERAVLNLALECHADLLILDDRKARNEARDLGLSLAYTTDLLKAAEDRRLIASYVDTVVQLRGMNIFLPE